MILADPFCADMARLFRKARYRRGCLDMSKNQEGHWYDEAPFVAIATIRCG
jgi:hypothetical protein